MQAKPPLVAAFPVLTLLVALTGPARGADPGLEARFGPQAVTLAGGEAAVRARVERTPREVADQLAQAYGNHFDTVMYQPALALIGRLQLGELTGVRAHRDDVERLVLPYVLGMESTLGAKPGGSVLAGHLIFAALADRTMHPRYIAMTQSAADHAFDADGNLREAMPGHNEMSDAVFMACPLLAAAGRLTGDARYVAMAERHLQFMRRLCLRADGLYRHSPLCEAPWGRGNGFPAIGLALSLTDLDAISSVAPTPGSVAPQARPGPALEAARPVRAEMLEAFQEHMSALLGHQDDTGMWHQVINAPGSYPELTATCMITFAMVRGMRQGWLDEDSYAPVVERAWEAIKVRVGSDGRLFQVCPGTGKQQTLQDYFDRPPVNGRDERGGAMALICAVEIAMWQEGRGTPNATGETIQPRHDP